ncbi:MAG: HAD-IIA family hydrolase [Thermoproteota archaeon]
MVSINILDIKQELLQKKGYIFDIEGVLCNNIDQVETLPKVVQFIEELRRKQKKIAILTNVSRKPKSDIYDKISKMGLNVKEDELFTAGAVTAEYIKKNFEGSKCFIISEGGLKEEIKKSGIEVVENNQANIVVVGANRKLTYKEMNHAMRLILDGAKLICAGTTTKFKGSYFGDVGYFMGEYCIANALKIATDTDILYIGKPFEEIFNQVLEKLDVKNSESVMIGDTISSDIEGANRSQIDSILVTNDESLGFENSDDFYKNISNTETKPKYVFKNIKEMYDLLFD